MGRLDRIPEPSILVADRSQDSQKSSLQRKVEWMELDIRLLLETLAYLSDPQLRRFQNIFLRQSHPHKLHSDIPQRLLKNADPQYTVLLLVDTCGQRSMGNALQIFGKMKRFDLAERLSGSAPTKELDEHLSGLIHKVAKMAVFKSLLTETLDDIDGDDLKILKWFLQSTYFNKGLPQIPWNQLVMADMTGIVDNLVVMCGQQCLEVTSEVLKDMSRDYLLFMLSQISLEPEVSPEETWPALEEKVEEVKSVIGLLLETLAQLSDGDFEEFKCWVLSEISRQRHYSSLHWEVRLMTDLQDTVFLMVQMYNQWVVEKTTEILKKMKKNDLVLRLSSSGAKETLSEDELHTRLIEKVAAMAAVKHLLLAALRDLDDEELTIFKRFLWSRSERGLSQISSKLTHTANTAEIVDVMVEELGMRSVEVVFEAVKYINKTDVLMRPKTYSELQEKRSMDVQAAALLRREKEVKRVLLEPLMSLSQDELKKFMWLLQFTCSQKGFPQISKYHLELVDSPHGLVGLMGDQLGLESLEVTREVLLDLDKASLAKKLPKTDPGSKGCSLVLLGLKTRPEMLNILSQVSEADLLFLFKEEKSMTPVMGRLLEIFEDLSQKDLKHFKNLLQSRAQERGLREIPSTSLEMAGRLELAELMVETYREWSVELTMEVLEEMDWTHLVKKLSESGSASEGTTSRLEQQGGGIIPLRGCTVLPEPFPLYYGQKAGVHPGQESSDWAKLNPGVDSTDVSQATTYSLQSGAGHFECSVSGLRWFCKEKVIFKYQFCSWEGHMERMKDRQYSPAGPLMDVTVITGIIKEVWLPHWVCIDDVPHVLDNFRVLHLSADGEVLEKVSEVTASHVKLTEPDFSSFAALVSSIFRVRVSCNVLMYYQPNTTFLKLRVYLIPHDAALKETVDMNESSRGFDVIIKPRPDRQLRMHQAFSLTATTDMVEIQPERITLRYDSHEPNFYEVFMENPDRRFCLQLRSTSSQRDEPIWSCEVRKADHPKSGPAQAESGAAADATSADVESLSSSSSAAAVTEEEVHFVDKHYIALVNRVSNIDPILDILLTKNVIQRGVYSALRALPTPEDKVREIFSGPLKAGTACKDIFYSALQSKEPHLIEHLKRAK